VEKGESEMTKKVMLTGNYAAAHGAISSKVQVIPAYPITPQTTIIEKLASIIETEKLPTKFITVESEHSAMAACIGASSTGARTYTATASQGLLLMCEGLHWAARARLPIVLANVNRALAPPWSIWVHHHDFMSQRDAGWIQFYAGNNQEVYDLTIQSFRLSEDSQVLLPSMVCLDGFILSHTFAPVVLFEEGELDEYLPPYDPKHLRMDPDNPYTLGNMTPPDPYFDMTKKIHFDQLEVLKVFPKIEKEFQKLTGRKLGIYEAYKMEDAEIVLMAMGTMGEEARITIDNLRKEGLKIGLFRLRLFRPFPKKEILKIATKANAIVVIDRSVSFGQEGHLANEVKAALFEMEDRPFFEGIIMGLGGQDVNYEDIGKVTRKAITKWKANKPSHTSVFIKTTELR
jgi:2-oxoisovalerate ferredoxin oxidoreductase alpha subunit